MTEVRIRYERNVPARGSRRAFLEGEEYVAQSAEFAAEHHPDARIVSYADGSDYDAAPAPPKQSKPERPGPAQAADGIEP